MPATRLVAFFLVLSGCQPRTIELAGDRSTTSTVTDALDARLSALEEQVTDLTSQVSDLEGVVAEDRQTIYALEAELGYVQDDVAELQAAEGSSGDTGSSDSETIDALVTAVTDLQENEPAAWSTTGTNMGESSSWQVLATDKLEITGDGPVIAWCSAAFSGTSGQLKLVLSTETSSSSTTAISGSSVAGLFNPAAGTWTLECQGLGGPWAISTLVAIQVPDNGA